MSDLVMVVEDDPEIRGATCLRLRSLGYQTVCSVDGIECLETVAVQKPDVILMDIRMPRMGGLQAITALQSNPSTSSIPIVVLSASPGDQATALDCGAKYFLRKPYRTVDFVAAISSVLNSPCSPTEAQR